MLERIFIVVFSLLFLGGFFARNLKVAKRTGQKIRAMDPLVTTSIALSTAVFMVAAVSVFSPGYYALALPLSFLNGWPAQALGVVFMLAGLLLGWAASAQLKDSWRVGVHEDQKTDLITSGLYAKSRNPYFSSYFLVFAGLFLFRPSLVLGALAIAIMVDFHVMVKKEEVYLEKAHGQAYRDYKARTGRYWTR